ncbi:hypothetical protein BDEG_28212 [Batrachochytrium dendrobatidis JEL423]|uniref:Gag1-like clamp domain-containing protein n=1 Tax=Batrachochytrium dendrobatidis (strain JEL423) TaxID=403673 RepID=A0A177WZD2_BATDL|nr:hypothetical protein BDEG_28212 [Batrachochytrium dendrobatidis JEL423]
MDLSCQRISLQEPMPLCNTDLSFHNEKESLDDPTRTDPITAEFNLPTASISTNPITVQQPLDIAIELNPLKTRLGQSPSDTVLLNDNTFQTSCTNTRSLSCSTHELKSKKRVEDLEIFHANIEQDRQGIIGYLNWQMRRDAWRKQHTPYDPTRPVSTNYKNNTTLQEVESTHHASIYESMISGRKFSKAVPVSFVIIILIHGWRSDGLVPANWPPPFSPEADSS